MFDFESTVPKNGALFSLLVNLTHYDSETTPPGAAPPQEKGTWKGVEGWGGGRGVN